MRLPVVVVTQGEDDLARELRERGAETRLCPTIAIAPVEDPAPLDRALAELASFDWLIVTSRHAVEATCSRPAWPKALPVHLRVAAVGPATAECLRERSIRADLVPLEAGASGLLGTLEKADGRLESRRILWPRGNLARPELRFALRAAGTTLVDPIAYRTVPRGAPTPELSGLRLAIERGAIDAVTFMSPSAAEGLRAGMGASDLAALRGCTLVASIGPTTSRALTDLGAPPDLEGPERSAASLASALMQRLRALQESSS